MRTLDETMIGIRELNEKLKKQSYSTTTTRRFFLRDTSGVGCYGYSYSLVIQEKTPFIIDEDGVIFSYIWKDIKTLAKSNDTYMPNIKNVIGDIGSYGQTFDRVEIDSVLGGN